MSIGAHLELVEPQQAVLEMSMKVDRNITTSALSEDGRWIAIADIEETRLFRVEDDVGVQCPPLSFMLTDMVATFNRAGIRVLSIIAQATWSLARS